MTLEEIKLDVDRQIARCDTYGYGLISKVLKRIKRLLDDLEPSWHEYPKEKPTEDGAYLITRYTKHGGIFIDIDSWISEYEMFDSTEDIPSSMKVLAWMELPKPYKEVE